MPLNFIAKAALTIGLTAANAALTMSRRIEGPRLDDRTFNDGDYGASISRGWGKWRQNPPIFWAEDLREVKRRRKTKGGKYNEYTYFGTWAVMLACHEIAGISRIWFDNKLVFDLTGAGPVTPFDFGDRHIVKDPDAPFGIGFGGINYGDAIALYLGTETQEPDPRIQAWTEARHGEGSCSAHRGSAYMALKDIPLEKFGNRIPQVSVETLGVADAHYPYEVKPTVTGLSDAFFSQAYATLTGINDSHYEIWDTAARGVMITGSTGVSFNLVPGWGTTSSGQFRAVSASNRYLYIASPDGVEWAQEFDFGAGFTTDQERVFSITDGNGVDHWGTVPWSTNAKFFYDGLEMTMAPLTGVAWRPTHYFRDAFGDIWACGCQTGTVSTAYFLRLTALGDSDIPNDFYAIPGLSSANTPDVYACHFQDDTHNQFAFSWNGSKTYIFDLLTNTLTDTGAAGLGGRAAVVYANLVPGASSIWYSSTGSTFYEYDLADFSLIRSLSINSWLGAGFSIDSAVYDPITHAMVVKRNGQSNLAWLYLDRVTSNGVTLQQVTEDACGVAEIDAADIDAGALTQIMPGYSVTQGSPKDWLEPALDLHDVDPRPHGFQLEFLPRGGAAGAAISSDVFALPDGGGSHGDGGNTYSFPRSGGTDVPALMTLNFADVNADLEKNQAMSGPLTATDGNGKLTLDMSTLALDGDTARQLLARYHRRKLMDRVPYSFALSARMAALEPGDVHPTALREVTEIMRCAKMELGADGRIATEWKRDDPSIALLDGAAGAAFAGHTPSAIAVPLISKGFARDIPLRTDADNDSNPLIHVAAAPYGAGSWPGAVMYQAIDGEYSDEFASIESNSPATWGYATGVLGDANPRLWDRGRSVNVRLQVGTLSGCTEADIDADPTLNLCMLGDEFLNFTTATLEGDGTYTLSGFKRGRRGTEWATGSHVSTDTFLLLDTAEPVEAGLSEVGTDLSFKAVTNGRTANAAFPIPVAPFTGASLKPYAPCLLDAVKDPATGDWTLTWVRRTRVGGAWTSGTSVPLSEASEAYQIDIGDGVTTALKPVTSATYTWSVADQITDTGAEVMEGDFEATVYQMSDAVGRGFPAALAA